MASIAARIRLSCLAVVQNRTPNSTAAAIMVLDEKALSTRTVPGQ